MSQLAAGQGRVLCSFLEQHDMSIRKANQLISDRRIPNTVYRTSLFSIFKAEMTDSDGKSRLHVGQSHIEDAIKTKPELARYATMLKELDTDRDGSLNISEVCAALDRIVKSEKQNRLLKWFAAITTGLLLLR